MTHQHQFDCPETEAHAARHAKPVHDEAEHDDFLNTVFGEPYPARHAAEVSA